MGRWWARQTGRRGTCARDDVGRADVDSDGGFINPQGAPRRARTAPLRADASTPAPEPVVIDLTDTGWTLAAEPDPVSAAELADRFRARAARAEAERDLIRLRARHWSGERVLEEGRHELEWWEHSDADPYAVLGLLPGATIDEVSAARRRVAQRCHPDRLGVDDDIDDALRRMVAANAAYDRIRRALNPV